MVSFRSLRSAVCAAGVLLCAGLLLPSVSYAQSLTNPDEDQPVALVADEIIYDSETGEVTATGSVEVYYGQRTLTADQIVYDERTGRIRATGDLVLRDPEGTTVFADAADLDADLKDGLVEGAQSILDQNTRMAAVEARRVDERYNTLSKAVYSPCEICSDSPTPLWRIRARRVIHDEERKIIHYESAWLDVMGVPIGWLPYFQHSDPSVDRTSGLLFPQFVTSTVYGYGIKQPIYWAIDESSDLTLTPFVFSEPGAILEGEYRRAFDSGDLRIFGSISHDDFDGENRIRGHVDTDGKFDLGDRLKWGWDITFASDDAYLSRFDYNYPNRLNSELFLERYQSRGFFDVSALYFQSLRSTEPAGDIPVALPVLDARQELEDKFFGGTLGFFTSGHVLVRNNGRDTSRLTLGLDWERNTVLPSGIALTGFAEGRADLFSNLDDSAGRDEFTARFSGQVGIEARYPWIFAQESGATHIIEPVVQAIVAPYGGNGANIPVEDSLVTELDETNVIDWNHFSGLDNVEDGPRLNLLVRYDAQLSDQLGFDASAGRVLRLEDSAAFSIGSGLRDNLSDYVAAWNLEWNPYLTISHRMRFDDDFKFTRNEIGGSLSLDPFRVSGRYVFFEADPEIDSPLARKELSTSASWKINDNWSVSSYASRNLVLDDFNSAGGTITYRNECCEIEVFGQRDFNSSSSAPASNTFGLRIELLTIGTGD
ncbi:MAG: LPS assembly protein LptD [Pseudomonadota bacterium]